MMGHAPGEDQIMAAKPVPRKRAPACRLRPFDPAWADHVIAWVRDPQETYWLAPKTRPPLTANCIARWREPGHDPFLLWDDSHPTPLAYGELNRLARVRRQYWLGHLLVDPAHRGRGLGVELTRLLLREAFTQRGAARVTLIVFQDNARAIACYRAAGMHDDGFEWHQFPLYGRRECLLRLAASPGNY
jgi:RimJ/RimL family protein N-acetyltransferase